MNLCSFVGGIFGAANRIIDVVDDVVVTDGIISDVDAVTRIIGVVAIVAVIIDVVDDAAINY